MVSFAFIAIELLLAQLQIIIKDLDLGARDHEGLLCTLVGYLPELSTLDRVQIEPGPITITISYPEQQREHVHVHVQCVCILCALCVCMQVAHKYIACLSLSKLVLCAITKGLLLHLSSFEFVPSGCVHFAAGRLRFHIDINLNLTCAPGTGIQEGEFHLTNSFSLLLGTRRLD